MKAGFVLMLVSLQLFAQPKLEIFQNGNFKGLKDVNGKVVLEATYDDLGWSDGTANWHQSLIGFKRNEKWGFLDENGKHVTSAIYDKLYPLDPRALVVATKGKFTNRYFYGLIDVKGRLILNQDYFDIERQGSVTVITKLESGVFLSGALDANFRPIGKLEYDKVEVFKNVLICTDLRRYIDLFDKQGTAIATDLDEVRKDGDFLITKKEGFSGLINSNGEVIHEPVHKRIDSHDQVIAFATWEIQGNGDSQEVNCDSLTYINDDLWLQHFSNVVKFYSKEKAQPQGQFSLDQVEDGITVLKRVPDGMWMAYDSFGELVLSSPDSIRFTGKFFLIKDRSEWRVRNKLGVQVSDKSFEKVVPMNDRFLAVRKFGFWAILDGVKKELTDFRYDEIESIIGSKAIVKFVKKWGVIWDGDWLIPPDHDEITWSNDHFLARSGESHYLYNSYGTLLFKTIDEIVARDGYFALYFDGKWSALNGFGRPIANTEYKAVNKLGSHFVLKDRFSELLDEDGKILIDSVEQMEGIYQRSEGLFLIKRNGSFGFVNDQGLLRVANRYDSAHGFTEGLAGVQLRGKWGFIDRSEKLIIQPHYTSVTPMDNGVSVYGLSGKFGFLSSDGKELSGADFTSVKKTTSGDYIVETDEGKVGLVNSNGIIVLSPIYDRIEERAGSMLLVELNGKQGFADNKGKTITRINYLDVRNVKDFLLLRKD